MATGQKLRGFVAQGMSGARRAPAAYTANFPVGSWTFTAPLGGRYRFIMWGGGGAGINLTSSGASGAYCEYTRVLGQGETVALVVGNTSSDSTATFRDGKVVTAGGATTTTPGTATGGDVNLNGSVGGTDGQGTGGGASGGGGANSGGGGAPGVLPFRGGKGQVFSGTSGITTPGGGGAQQATSGPGTGLILVERVRPRQ